MEDAGEDVFGVVGPVRDGSRKIVAAPAIAGMPGQRPRRKYAFHYVHFVKEEWAEVSSALGYLKIRLQIQP